METKYYTKKNIIISFFLGVFIGLGVYYLFANLPLNHGDTAMQNDDTSLVSSETSTISTDDSTLSSDTSLSSDDEAVAISHTASRISVHDQPAGFHVVVDSITLAQMGWAVVQEDVAGVPGNILGAQRFDVGTWSGTVDLLRNTEEGSTYYATVYTDNGDKEFDHMIDTPIPETRVSFEAIRIR